MANETGIAGLARPVLPMRLVGACGPRNVWARLDRNIVLGRFAICLGSVLAATCRRIHFSVRPLSLYSGAMSEQNLITSSSRKGYRVSTEECIEIRSPFEIINKPASITL